MKQATTGNKDIIKKLLTDSLSPEEREKLNNYKFVNQAIYSQWEQASDMYTDVDKEERMLTNVMHQIKKGKTGRDSNGYPDAGNGRCCLHADYQGKLSGD